MKEAISWEFVQASWKQQYEEMVDYYVDRVNKLLCQPSFRCPAGHWMFENVVPVEYRRNVAERFARTGWRVSFDDRHFNMNVPETAPKDTPYR